MSQQIKYHFCLHNFYFHWWIKFVFQFFKYLTISWKTSSLFIHCISGSQKSCSKHHFITTFSTIILIHFRFQKWKSFESGYHVPYFVTSLLHDFWALGCYEENQRGRISSSWWNSWKIERKILSTREKWRLWNFEWSFSWGINSSNFVQEWELYPLFKIIFSTMCFAPRLKVNWFLTFFIRLLVHFIWPQITSFSYLLRGLMTNCKSCIMQ